MSASERRLLALLNKIRAMMACGAGKPSQLALYVLPGRDRLSGQNQVNQWLNGTRKPSGESTMAIVEWAAARTLEIDAGGEETQEAYRRAYRKITKAKPNTKTP